MRPFILCSIVLFVLISCSISIKEKDNKLLDPETIRDSISSNKSNVFYDSCKMRNSKAFESETIFDNLSLGDKVELLKSINLKLSNGIVHQQKFYRAFPDNFETFEMIFGNDPKYIEMYPDVEIKWIQYFFDSLTFVEKELIYQRIISIGKDGKWDADGVNYFQHGMREKIKSNLSLSIEILKSYSAEEVISFWYFYYDGPHPENYKMDFVDLYPKVKAIDQEVSALMKEAYKELLQKSDGHGH